MICSFCWSCFSMFRPSPRGLLALSSVTRTATLHTTIPLYAAPLKKSRSADAGPKFREARSARIKKKARREKLRPPAVGERKALRQRIVLSNTNALEVSGLQDLTVENMVDSRLRGQVLGLPVPLLDLLRAVHAFRPPQGWRLFRRPATL